MSNTSATTAPTQPFHVLIVYYSRFGSCRALAQAVQAGVAQVPNTTTELLEIADTPFASLQGASTDQAEQAERTALLNRLARADALIVGGPAYFGSVASPLKRFFEDLATASSKLLDRTRPWHHYLFRDKPGAAFITSATPHGGNEQALHSILTMMMHLGMLVITPGQRGPILEQPDAPYGATVVTGPGGDRELTAEETTSAKALGQRVAEVGTWIRTGRLLEAERLQAARKLTADKFDPSA